MSAIVQDDRTPEQLVSHPFIIGGRDVFLSNGICPHGRSYAAWACRLEDVDAVDRWVRDRDDISRVRFVDEQKGERYRPRAGHLHIYVVGPAHPAVAR